MATVFEVRDEIREVAEPMIPPVKVPERQGRRPVVGRVCFDTASGVSLPGEGRAFGEYPAIGIGCATHIVGRAGRPDWPV